MNECIDPYERLVQAIAAQAAKDYRKAREKLRKRPKNIAAQQMLYDCEKFFRSGWFYEITGLDGKAVLKKLEEEFDEG